MDGTSSRQPRKRTLPASPSRSTDVLRSASNWTVSAFCEKNEIDYLVVDRHHFSEEYIGKGRIYFDPFNQEILEQIKGRRA